VKGSGKGGDVSVSIEGYIRGGGCRAFQSRISASSRRSAMGMGPLSAVEVASAQGVGIWCRGFGRRRIVAV